MDRERIWALLETAEQEAERKADILYSSVSYSVRPASHSSRSCVDVYPKYDPEQVGIIRRSGTGAVLRRARYLMEREKGWL